MIIRKFPGKQRFIPYFLGSRILGYIGNIVTIQARLENPADFLTLLD